jgi:hypothetical protein
VRGSDRWKRKVVKTETTDGGKRERTERMEYILVPEVFDLGLEEKGMEMNNRGRLKITSGGTERRCLRTGQGGLTRKGIGSQVSRRQDVCRVEMRRGS